MFVTGYAIRAPASANAREFYENLRDGVDMTSPTKRYPEGYMGLPPRTGTLKEIDRFDQDFFHFSTKQTEKMDIVVRMLLEVTHEALMDARLSVASLRGSRTGVYVGHCFSDYLNRSTNDPKLTGYELVNGAHTMAANKISFFYNLKGPSMAIDTACSSSLVALHQARMDVANGIVDRAIVSGVSLTIDPKKNGTFNAFTMLSPDGRCYTFDTRANGYCRSEGIVTVIIESAKVRPGGICQLLGTSVNSDGYKEKGITFPSGVDQAENARCAFRSSGVDPSSITYVEAHGTGTVAGDKQELLGLSEVFYGPDYSGATGEEVKTRGIPIGSIKSCMGHAEGASGLVSLVKCLVMYENKQLLPNQNFIRTEHVPLLDGRFTVQTALEPWCCGNACISNYGFGGTNAFAVVGPGNVSYVSPTPALKPASPQSGSDAPLSPSASLADLANLNSADSAESDLCFSNASATDFSAVSKAWMLDQVKLGNDVGFRYRAGKSKRVCSKVCFLYGGQGSQWPSMGQRLYRESPAFKETIARLSGYLKQMDASIDLEALFDDGQSWMMKKYSVLGIAAYQVATTNILADVGIVPDFYLGHSLGETAAGYARGVQTEEETIKIAYVRSRLSNKIKPGQYILKTKNGGKLAESEAGVSHLADSDGFQYYDVTAEVIDAVKAKVMQEADGDAVFDLTGQMVAVGLESSVILAAIEELGLGQTCVACYNSPKGQTVSGPAKEVVTLKEHLSASIPNLFWREIDTDRVAYHAPYLSCFKDFLVKEFTAIVGNEPRPLDGKWLCTSTRDPKEFVLDAHYHARNIVSPVFFQQALETLPPNTLVVEIGSSQSLLGQVKRIRTDIELLGLVKRLDPSTEGYYLEPSLAKKAVWEAGYAKAFASEKDLKSMPGPLERLPFQTRWPELWDHSKECRIFTHKDFEYVLSSGDDASSGMTTVTYNLVDEHAFLLDHRVNGRALFPATGHLYTMWQAKCKCEQGLKLSDFEINSAVVLDPNMAEEVTFYVAEMGDKLAVIHEKEVVAAATFTFLPESAPASFPRAALAPVEASAGGALPLLQRKQLYMHFKRYGYEYQEEFQLVERRTVPSKEKSGCYGVLRGAAHLIPFMDNFLQLFLEDVRMLQLPTLIREVELLPGAVAEAAEGSTVNIESASHELTSPCLRMKGLNTMPAAGPQHDGLIHLKQVFLPLGEHIRPDKAPEVAFLATRKYIAAAITAHCGGPEGPALLAERPWLSQVLSHAAKTLGADTAVPAVDEALYESSLHYRMHVDLYKDLPALIASPFLTLSLHPEHDAFYENNHVMASSAEELATLVGLVCKEWHGTDLSIWEGGAGSCGFTRRVIPLVEQQLEQYVCSDISAIRLGTLEGHPKISSSRHDLNGPIELPKEAGDGGLYHLCLANNAIHTAGDVKETLEFFRDSLVDGGFILLEEQITDACLYLWGLDNFIWETARDTRSYGLWMAWSEWEALIAAVDDVELLVAYRSPYHVTMLLRKTTSKAKNPPKDVTVVDDTAWATLQTSLLGADAPPPPPSSSAAESAFVFSGIGADGLVKTIRLEEGTAPGSAGARLTSLVDDGSLASVDSKALPLAFNAVQDGKLGSLVTVPAIDAAAAAAAAAGGPGNFALHILRPGDLSTLSWIEAPTTKDYRVEVHFSALNFKDIMYAFGKLRLERPSFGLEFSGRDLETGKLVMGIGTSSCIAHRVKPALCWDVPEGMALADAATIPVVYATSMFALFAKANLSKGQTALIHAGSGGIGHSAIYLCQSRGIEVFTTCAPHKRQYIKDTFGLDDDHIANSRDTTFREQVLRMTDGEGVDCVLNSLSGECLHASLQCVKDFGHFCEIGKYDLQNNTRIGLKALERNVSYHAIDLATMFTHPRLSTVLGKLIQEGLDSGEIKPLPHTAFGAADVQNALRFMSAGKHFGKVLVEMESFDASAPSSSPEEGVTGGLTPCFQTSGTHIITGGLGGFGLELAGWLFRQGATKVITTTRSGIRNGWQRYRFDGLVAAGLDIEISKLDVVDPEQCRQLLASAGGQLKGIWHVAMVLQDTLFSNMSAEKWDLCNDVKVTGLKNLDEMTAASAADLDAFVAFSSVSSLFGNVGQANYSHANAACETIIDRRKARFPSKKTLAVQWGMIDNVGFFTANDAKVLETFLAPQNIDASLDSLHTLLRIGGTISSYRLVPNDAEDDDAGGPMTLERIQAKVAEVLGGKAADFNPNVPLNDYGLDSLSSIEIVNWINRYTKQNVSVAFMSADMTIGKIFDHMIANA